MDFLTIVLQLVFGWLIKKWPVLASWPSKLIPIFNAILAILVRLVTTLSSGTAHADSLGVSLLPQPQHHHPGWWAVWIFIQSVLLNTVVATGIFSGTKNAIEHFRSTKRQQAAATKAKQ